MLDADNDSAADPSADSEEENFPQSLDDALSEGDDVADNMEEGEWGGISAEPPTISSGISRPAGMKSKKPPTGDELRAIKDASDLFRSSSFKLQVNRLDKYGNVLLTHFLLD